MISRHYLSFKQSAMHVASCYKNLIYYCSSSLKMSKTLTSEGTLNHERKCIAVVQICILSYQGKKSLFIEKLFRKNTGVL